MLHSDNNIEQSNGGAPVLNRSSFSLWKVLLPVAIGLAVIALMFWHDARKENMGAVFDHIHFTAWSIFCIFLAILCMCFRDLGLIWRFRELTDRKLSWKQAWTARFFVVNALFLGFLPQCDPYQWSILARQFVIWVVLMVSPTPGGSGLSEWLFSNYYGDLIGTAGMALIMAIFWRFITYYLYLVVGCLVLPSWLRTTYAEFRNKLKSSKSGTTANNPSADNLK